VVPDLFDTEFCTFEITFLEKGGRRASFLRVEDEGPILSSSSCLLLGILRAVRRVLAGGMVVRVFDDGGEKKI
jgi:hypothetical protein